MLDWFSLAILCAIAVASADALTKGHLGGYRAFEIVVVRFSLTGLLMLPLLLYTGLPPFSSELLLILVIMLPCEILAMLLYMKAIRDYPLSLTLPYLAFTPVIITLFAFLFLGEQVSAMGLAGIALVVSGGYVLNADPANGYRKFNILAPLKAAATNHGSQLMMVVACLYSITAVMGKAAISHVQPLTFAASYFVLLGLTTLFLVPIIQPHAIRGSMRKPLPSLMVAIAMLIMVITHFTALNMVETAYMLTVKRTSLLFGMLYGAWLFGERHLPRHLLSGSLMVLGVFFIYYGQAGLY